MVRKQRRVVQRVVEQHLEGVAFGVERRERAFESPLLTLNTLAQRTEAQLVAHLDGLLVGGTTLFEEAIAPLLAKPDPTGASRLVAAALVALARRDFEALVPALGHESPTVRRAAAEACSLAGSSVDAWVLERLPRATTEVEIASLCSVVERRGLKPPTLIAWLQSGDASLARAAAGAARHADPQRHLPVVEYLLDHQDREVRETALIAALAWSSKAAAFACEQWALDTATVHPLPMALYAALGRPTQHERLARRAALQTHRRSALFALGFSGGVAQLPFMVEQLGGADRVVAKIAAQAIATITGIDLADPSFIAEAPPGAPSEDEEAAEPAPEDELPAPNVDAIRRICASWVTKATTEGAGRVLGGAPFSPKAVMTWLRRAPLRRRHVQALALGVQTRGALWLDTRALSFEQRARIAAAKPQF